MNSRTNLEVTIRVARRSLVLVGLLAAGGFGVLTARAQAPTSNVPAIAKQEAKSTAPVAQAAAPKGAPASEEKSAPKGAQEGIKVHGHLAIELRSTDGKVEKHVEFDNALVTTNLADMDGGSSALFQLLSGNATFSAQPNSLTPGGGGWAINLQAPANSTAPCAFTSPVSAVVPIDSSLTPSCFITNVPYACNDTALGGTDVATDCTSGLQVVLGSSGITGAAGSLSFATATSLTLSGVATASQNQGYIGNVQTILYLSVPAQITGFGGVSGTAPITFPFLFTAHSVSTIGPISAGQQIAVSVTFSFS